jgi:hypothetical protein
MIAQPLGRAVGAVIVERRPVRVFCRPAVGDRDADVETFRDYPAEIAVEGRIVVAPFEHGRSSPLLRDFLPPRGAIERRKLKLVLLRQGFGGHSFV